MKKILFVCLGNICRSSRANCRTAVCVPMPPAVDTI